MTSEPTPPVAGSSAVVIKSAVAIVFGLLVSGVALAFAGWKPESIGGILTAIGTVAGGLLVLLPKLINVQQRVEQVAENTNGALRAYTRLAVREEVRAALDEYLGTQAATAPPPTPRKRR